MKPLVCFCLFMLVARPTSWGQGTVYLANRDPRTGLDAPIFNPGGVDRVSYTIQLEVLAGRDASNLSLVLPRLLMEENGYWRPQTLVLDSIAPGETAFLQVRAFLQRAGMSYDLAKEQRVFHGASEILSVVLGGDTEGGTHPPTLPTSLTGLKPIVLSGVPEPSSFHLLVLAAAAVWLTGRRAEPGLGGRRRSGRTPS